nr:ribonuclease H-like domain-containing protein [Tanacetum cinerariifolium]
MCFVLFGLERRSIADYYHKLNALWKQFDDMVELPKCICNASGSFKRHNQLMKLMQFLMGLDNSYMQIKSVILFREVLPDVRSAHATISSEESHRVASGIIVISSKRNEASAFVSNVSNKNDFQRNNQNINSGPRPNNLNNNRQGGAFALVCENCVYNGHTIERCFKIIGYPADFGKKKSGQNSKGKNVSNNVVGSRSSTGFTNEQMANSSLSSKIIRIERMSVILFREVLPDVRSAYATISSEESHRVASGIIVISSKRNEASAFVSNVSNKNNFQRNNQNINSGPRPNNLNNNRQGGAFALVCENCGYNGHTIERCFKIIGYPADFERSSTGTTVSVPPRKKCNFK